MSGLKPVFLALVKDLNGNHVIQTCLKSLGPNDNKVWYFDLCHLISIFSVLLNLWSFLSKCCEIFVSVSAGRINKVLFRYCLWSHWMLCVSLLCFKLWWTNVRDSSMRYPETHFTFLKILTGNFNLDSRRDMIWNMPVWHNPYAFMEFSGTMWCSIQ